MMPPKTFPLQLLLPRASAVSLTMALATTIAAAPVHADDLYQPTQFKALASDRKAFRVGDNLTVLIYESASMTTTAGTTSDKSDNIALTGKTKRTDGTVNLSTSNDAGGKGSIQRAGKLQAQVTVTVRAVEPSGLLAVSGDQTIAVNDEKQEIRLEGKVRPSDIAENNTVVSTRLADAKISYIGEGILGDRQRPGVLTKLWNWLGL